MNRKAQNISNHYFYPYSSTINISPNFKISSNVRPPKNPETCYHTHSIDQLGVTLIGQTEATVSSITTQGLQGLRHVALIRKTEPDWICWMSEHCQFSEHEQKPFSSDSRASIFKVTGYCSENQKHSGKWQMFTYTWELKFCLVSFAWED